MRWRCNAADGRFIPGPTVFATLIDQQGNEIGKHQQEFLWHPWLYHYGRNWQVPHDGPYTLRIRVEALDFPRHDKTNGRRFDQPSKWNSRTSSSKSDRRNKLATSDHR